jgi:phosphoglycerate dehydrogenase-like enzyme
MKVEFPPVLILASDAGEYLQYLQDLSDIGVELTTVVTAEAAREAYSGQQVILGQPDLVASVLADMPEIRWVQSSWAGVTPLLNIGRTDYLLTGVKNTFGPQMAQYVLAYLLANELKIFERLGRQANRSWWSEPSGSLQGKTVGIMGTGAIGSYIAGALKPFGVCIKGYSREGAPVAGFDRVYSGDSLASFLAEPDYLVCVLPDTPGTRHLLDAQAFRRMKNHCLLVNIGRGSVVDEQALAKALYAGELAGAVLDVFQQEPLPADSPLWNAPGLIVTGHVAARSWPSDIAVIFRENYRRYCAGEALDYRIDFERGY